MQDAWLGLCVTSQLHYALSEDFEYGIYDEEDDADEARWKESVAALRTAKRDYRVAAKVVKAAVKAAPGSLS